MSEIEWPKWKTIETAPKDGTPILLWWRHCGDLPAVGQWFWDNDITEGLTEGWRCEEDSCIPINQHDCTHWLPLPPPPPHSDEEAPRADTGSPQERGQPDTEDLSKVMI